MVVHHNRRTKRKGRKPQRRTRKVGGGKHNGQVGGVKKQINLAKEFTLNDILTEGHKTQINEKLENIDDTKSLSVSVHLNKNVELKGTFLYFPHGYIPYSYDNVIATTENIQIPKSNLYKANLKFGYNKFKKVNKKYLTIKITHGNDIYIITNLHTKKLNIDNYTNTGNKVSKSPRQYSNNYSRLVELVPPSQQSSRHPQTTQPSTIEHQNRHNNNNNNNATIFGFGSETEV
jgi:hypothetical protein